MYLWPLFNLDSRHKVCPALTVRTKNQGLAIRHPSGVLWESTGHIRKMSHNDCIGALRKFRHLLLKPQGLRFRPALHALTIVAEFSVGLRIAKLRVFDGFQRPIGGAGEHVSNRDL